MALVIIVLSRVDSLIIDFYYNSPSNVAVILYTVTETFGALIAKHFTNKAYC